MRRCCLKAMLLSLAMTTVALSATIVTYQPSVGGETSVSADVGNTVRVDIAVSSSTAQYLRSTGELLIGIDGPGEISDLANINYFQWFAPAMGGLVRTPVLEDSTHARVGAGTLMLLSTFWLDMSGSDMPISNIGVIVSGQGQVTVTVTPNNTPNAFGNTGYSVTAGGPAGDDLEAAGGTLVINPAASAVHTLTTGVVGGNGTVSDGGTYSEGTVVALTATPSTGYQVKAWSGADNVPGAGSTTNSVTMSSDKSVTVECEEIPPTMYTLTTSVGGGNGTVSDGGSYEDGATVQLIASPASGYRVKAWSGADNVPGAGSTSNTVVMSSAKAVTVEFEEIPAVMYVLTTSVVSGNGTISDGGTYPEGTVVALYH